MSQSATNGGYLGAGIRVVRYLGEITRPSRALELDCTDCSEERHVDIVLRRSQNPPGSKMVFVKTQTTFEQTGLVLKSQHFNKVLANLARHHKLAGPVDRPAAAIWPF